MHLKRYILEGVLGCLCPPRQIAKICQICQSVMPILFTYSSLSDSFSRTPSSLSPSDWAFSLQRRLEKAEWISCTYGMLAKPLEVPEGPARPIPRLLLGLEGE